MGQGNSKPVSFLKYGNDFELVIRATKELEWLLEEHFGAPGGKNVGLHDKISNARHDGQPLPPQMVRTMRKLVTIRNKLVHDRDFNTVPERTEFARSFDEVVAELQKLLKSKTSRGGGKGCTIC